MEFSLSDKEKLKRNLRIKVEDELLNQRRQHRQDDETIGIQEKAGLFKII